MVDDGSLRVRQILFNLLSNAIKFTHKGEVNIHVDSTRLEQDRHSIRIAIQDTGIGMSKHQLQNLFQRFAQADVSITRHMVARVWGWRYPAIWRA